MSAEEALDYAREKYMAELAVIRADILDILKLIGVEPAGTVTFADDLLAIRRFIVGLQESVDGLLVERMKHLVAIDELTAMKDAAGQKAFHLQDALVKHRVEARNFALEEAARICDGLAELIRAKVT